MTMMVINNEMEKMDNITKIFLFHDFRNSKLLPTDPNQKFWSVLPRFSRSLNVVLLPSSALIPVKKNIDAQETINRIDNKRISIRITCLQIRVITIQSVNKLVITVNKFQPFRQSEFIF